MQRLPGAHPVRAGCAVGRPQLSEDVRQLADPGGCSAWTRRRKPGSLMPVMLAATVRLSSRSGRDSAKSVAKKPPAAIATRWNRSRPSPSASASMSAAPTPGASSDSDDEPRCPRRDQAITRRPCATSASRWWPHARAQCVAACMSTTGGPSPAVSRYLTEPPGTVSVRSGTVEGATKRGVPQPRPTTRAEHGPRSLAAAADRGNVATVRLYLLRLGTLGSPAGNDGHGRIMAGYLVETDDGERILFDTGFPPAGARILRRPSRSRASRSSSSLASWGRSRCFPLSWSSAAPRRRSSTSWS